MKLQNRDSLMNSYQSYIHKSRYARYLSDQNRRETWEETVERYCDYFQNKYECFPRDRIYHAIHDMRVMPSMRCLMTAGPALDRDNVAGYNCSYVAIDDKRAFSEVFYVLLCGTGVGFSVERQCISQLPEVPHNLITGGLETVQDSKMGWVLAFETLINSLYSGHIPAFDYSLIRPAGALLQTFGGRASGPQPLIQLFEYTANAFKQAQGRKLTSIECHDLVCMIASVVLVGGVRRAALISLSNLSDLRMRNAKSGDWWQDNKQRAVANNSVVYTEKPDIEVFTEEWLALIKSKSGERGIVNRVASKEKCIEIGRDAVHNFGKNPCGEITLRNMQLCNLSEVIVRSGDRDQDLLDKVEIATIIGTFQSTLTDFKYLRNKWKENCEEERLLGVSLTGIMDHQLLNCTSIYTCELLKSLRSQVHKVNAGWAAKLGIAKSKAITTVKPSGTVSELCDTSSGIHPRFAEYYIRRVRADNKDPLCTRMIQYGVPHEIDQYNPNGTVFTFVKKAPEGARIRGNFTAKETLEHYKMFYEHWCDHTVSITVSVEQDEWLKVGAWVYENWNKVEGISFLPYSDHSYLQAPFEEINKEMYNEISKEIRTFNFDGITEHTDSSVIEPACDAGACSLS